VFVDGENGVGFRRMGVKNNISDGTGKEVVFGYEVSSGSAEFFELCKVVGSAVGGGWVVGRCRGGGCAWWGGVERVGTGGAF